MKKRVEGSYASAEEAIEAVERLSRQGYSRKDIMLIANEEVSRKFPYSAKMEITTTHDFQNFSGQAEEDPLSPYRDEMESGHIVVLVEEETLLSDPSLFQQDLTKEKADSALALRAEHLEVTKREVESGEVRIRKRIVEETQMIEVPYIREEVTIERRTVPTGSVWEGEVYAEDEEIVIPVLEEQVTIEKEVEVLEEVDIRKEKVTEQKQVSGTVRREELDVETEGDVHVKKQEKK